MSKRNKKRENKHYYDIGGFLGELGNSFKGGATKAITNLGLKTLSGLANKAFTSEVNEQAILNAKTANTLLGNIQFLASNTTDLLNQSNFGMLDAVKKSDIGKDAWFNHKASKITNSLNEQRALANLLAIANFGAAVNSLDTQNDLNILANYAAYGGPLTMGYTGVMSPFGSQLAFGGNLLTQGGEWSNGLRVIGNGGTHEENPMLGVPMGMDLSGIPNLVEEGEVIFNDYVFSDRMKVPKAVKSKYKLRENKDVTFADAAKKLGKEAEERPNDPISKLGLETMLNGLASVQEDERLKKQMRNPEFRQQLLSQLIPQELQYAEGGILGKKYRGTGPYPNVLDIPDQTEPYAYYGNTGRNKATNPRIVGGWSSFTDNSGASLFNTISNTYNTDYTGSAFKSWLLDNYDSISKNWWTPSNAPDYFKAGNTEAPSAIQMLGNSTTPGLMYDKKYGEAHLFGRYAYNKYKDSLTPNFIAPTSMKVDATIKGLDPSDIKPLDFTKSSGKGKRGTERYQTWMRYAPVLGSAIGVGTSFKKPDYYNSDRILEAANEAGNYTPIDYKPVGDYLTYNPFDRNYYINKLNAQSGATRRAIVNQSAGNRATAMAGLLAADYNAQGKLGDLARQAEEYNLAQRQKVTEFNRATNMANSEMGLKAAMANQEAALKARSARLSGIALAMSVRDAIDSRRNASMSANLTNLFDSLGNIGKEEFIKDMIKKNPALYYDYMGNYKG